jgi:spermidine/putrescine transport system substrate-binding protein
MSRTILICILTMILVSACTKKNGTGGNSPSVNLAIWSNYLTPEMQEKFQRETGVQIHTTTYTSNEELLAKIQMGSAGIDVAVPSDYMVNIMIKMNLLEPLKTEKLLNKDLIADLFLKQPYDAENKFSLPYTWTTTGIAVNTELYKKPLKSWKDLLANPALKGKFALLDDVRETTGAALKMQGHSVNTTSTAELKNAKLVLLAAKPNLKMFTSDTIEILKNNEVVAAQAYSSDALQAAAKSGGKIKFVLPEEGGTKAIDNLVAVKGGKNPEAAMKLINFLLSQENELIRVNTLKVGPVLKGTKAQLPADLQGNKALFPEEAELKKLEPIRDLGDANRMYEDLWTEVKTTN